MSGAKNGAATKAAALTPVELAKIAVKQREALRDDAKAQLSRAADARAARESDAIVAATAHAEALAASAANRADDTLADAAGRASVRLHHASADLDAAVTAYEAAVTRASDAEKNVTIAEQALEREELLASLAVDVDAVYLAERADDIVRGVLMIRDAALALRERARSDRRIVQRVHQLGGAPSLREPDGVRQAGYVARRLAEAGGALASGENPGPLRWWADPPAAESTDAAGHEATAKLVAVILDALRIGARDTNGAGRDRLRRHGEAWLSSLHYLEAQATLDADGKAEADARAREVARAHERRLAAVAEAQARRPGGAVNRGVGRDQPLPPPPARDGSFVLPGAVDDRDLPVG